VFHRWHHTHSDEGGNTNFGSLLSIWDVLFGTFRMPANELPSRYGLDERGYPQGFLAQMAHPFRQLLERPQRAATLPPPAP
jgi:sterol desaturase/sphingolipid hydroxylase (fatty acid hydroxylase superfamily)